MPRMTAQEWSRYCTVTKGDGEVSWEVIQVGALLRIAEALELIERHMFRATPEGEKAAAKGADDERRRKAWQADVARVRAAIEDRGGVPMAPLTRESMALAFVWVCGLGADPDDPANWMQVVEGACGVVKPWGLRRSEQLLAWVRRHWPGESDEADAPKRPSEQPAAEGGE